VIHMGYVKEKCLRQNHVRVLAKFGTYFQSWMALKLMAVAACVYPEHHGQPGKDLQWKVVSVKKTNTKELLLVQGLFLFGFQLP
jgi:hypothetical protein